MEYCEENDLIPSKELYRKLSANPGDFSFHTMDLSAYFLTGNGLMAVLPLLQLCTSLWTLNLEANGIDDKTCCQLCDILLTHFELSNLNLADNPIGRPSGRKLLQVASQCEVLITLNLRGTKVPSTLKTKIRWIVAGHTPLQFDDDYRADHPETPANMFVEEGKRESTISPTAAPPSWVVHSVQEIEACMRKYKYQPWQVFESLDTSRQGKLGFDEFENGIHRMSIIPCLVSAGRILDFFSWMDKDKDGFLTRVEFINHFHNVKVPSRPFQMGDDEQHEYLRAVLDSVFDAKESIKEVFNMIDIDGSGTISKDELAKGLIALRCGGPFGFLNELFRRWAVDEIFGAIDKDHSNELDYNEFVTHFESDERSAKTLWWLNRFQLRRQKESAAESVQIAEEKQKIEEVEAVLSSPLVRRASFAPSALKRGNGTAASQSVSAFTQMLASYRSSGSFNNVDAAAIWESGKELATVSQSMSKRGRRGSMFEPITPRQREGRATVTRPSSAMA
eukprot:TRINITY_DN66714_c5_g1_i1.p1 TRINITY_DN66714_c5_g1~~TRINITY_DN66714_c5_g1_i1.p1  ORF type:complete len:506 (+),score=38.80 TRINITY_DN66714_c5_g1_i1:204-1721(+)